MGQWHSCGHQRAPEELGRTRKWQREWLKGCEKLGHLCARGSAKGSSAQSRFGARGVNRSSAGRHGGTSPTPALALGVRGATGAVCPLPPPRPLCAHLQDVPGSTRLLAAEFWVGRGAFPWDTSGDAGCAPEGCCVPLQGSEDLQAQCRTAVQMGWGGVLLGAGCCLSPLPAPWLPAAHALPSPHPFPTTKILQK